MKVLIADDNVIVRAGLSTLLRRLEYVDEILEAGDGAEAIELTRREKPEVILLDVDMPRLGGLEALPTIVGTSTVLMLTNSRDSATIRRALDLGARGYLVHGGIGLEELAGALRTCTSGGLVLGPEAAAVVVDGAEELAANPLRALVTEREAQVLDAAADGMSNDEIGRAQFLSTRTVKNYLNSAYPKLGVHSRAEAVLAWTRGASGGRSGLFPGRS